MDQRIDVMEALRGVTINGAYMQRLEDKIGSLEKGKLAEYESQLAGVRDRIKELKESR